ncbi:ATP-binding protein [Photobacterium leiognathi]|uniref:ATP-binding protein n=1 Tax=Photobacterium leiognathi TaxID=553611 RepID=UPI0029814EB9|nr:ATP-binding protein [Photobacterium leiognathi]
MNKVFVSLYLLFSSLAFASSEEVTHDSLIKIGVPTGAQQPFWGGSTKLPSGILHDMTSLFAKFSNSRVEYIEVQSISDAYKALNDGRIDLTMNYRSQSQVKDPALKYYPLYRETVVGWIYPGYTNTPNNELRWACTSNSAFCKILEELNWNFIKTETANSITKLILEKDANAAIGPYNSFIYYFKNNEAKDQSIVFDRRFGSVTADLITRKNNIKINKKVKDFIKKLDGISESEFKSIKNKYHIESDIFNKWYKKEKEITIKYDLSTNLFPYSFYNKNTGEYEGVIHDIFKKISKLTPLKFEFVHYDDISDKYLLRNHIIDVIPMIRRLDNTYNDYIYTSDFINVDFAKIINLNTNTSDITGILDIFGYSKNVLRENLKTYKSIEKIIHDLKIGKIKTAYINQQLLEELYYNGEFRDFDIITEKSNNEFNIKVPMLLRTEDKHLKSLLNDAFNMIPQSEMNTILSRYNKFDYQIGYQKKQVEIIALAIAIVTLLTLLFFYISVSKLKKKADGEKIKSSLSDAQTKWLYDIIDHIPNAVCINDNEKVILSNTYFKKLVHYFNFEDEECLLKYILEEASFISNNKSSQSITLTTMDLKKYYDVVNGSISGYLDKIELRMLHLTDVTVQKEKEKALIKLNKTSELLLQQKKQFLAIVSHELRTPISGIVGMIELLEQRSHSDLEEKMLKNALSSANKLNLLVNDILDFSKIDAKQLKISPEDTNIAIELSAVIQSFENLALRKGLTFKIDWEPSAFITYHIDILRVSQIISNVLSNAIKFTDEGLIALKIRTLNNQLSFSIKDTGIGMTIEEQQHLFDPFAQAQDSIARKYGGTGLGMAIVRNLVELMQGTISVNSLSEVGTTVNISLFAESRETIIPKASQTLEVNNVQLSTWLEVLGINHLLITPDLEKNKRINFYPSKIFELFDKKPMLTDNKIKPQLSGHVLVVEDDPLNRNVFKMQLDSLNLVNSLVKSGKEAIEFINKTPKIDVIISDYHMPGMNGFELANYIRRSEKEYAHIPIIICTADNTEDVKNKAFKVGINSILYKPYSIMVLTEKIYELLPDKGNVIDTKNLTNLPSVKTWLQKFERGDQTAMIEAIIESLSTAVTALRDEGQCTKTIAHRLKGALGTLELFDIVQICNELELAPDNITLKNLLISQLETLIFEAKELK